MLVWASSSMSTIWGRAGEDGGGVHLLEDDALVLDAAAGNLLQLFGELGGAWAAMGFNYADDDVFAALAAADGFAEHVVGLADAGRVAEKELEGAASLFGRDLFEPLFRTLGAGNRGVATGHKAKINGCDALLYSESFVTVFRRLPPLPL